MKITSLRFASVPFDNSYRNVYSAINENGKFIGANFKKEIENYIVENFSNILITPSSIRSVRRSDITCSFNCALPLSVDIDNYNYVILYNEDEISFWFINNYNQENTKANNVNYSLVLEYDVWNNNQDDVYNENKAVLVEQTHIQQLERNPNDNHIQVKAGLNIFPNQPTDFDLEEDQTNFGYKVLWLNIRTTHKVKFKWVNDDGENKQSPSSNWENLYGTYKYSSGTFQDFFIPVLIYDGSFNYVQNLYSTQFKCANSKNGNAMFQPQSILNNLTEDIVSARYTFNIPSNVTYSLSVPGGDFLIVNVGRARYGSVYLNETKLFDCLGFHPFATNDLYYGSEILDTKDTELYKNINYSDEIFNNDEVFNCNDYLDTTPLSNRYPFRKNYIKMGTTKQEIVEKTFFDSFSIKFQPSCDGGRCFIKGGRSGNNFYSNEFTPLLIETTTSLPVTVSQIDVYLRNNGQRLSTDYQNKMAINTIEKNKIEADIITNTVKSSSSTVTGVIGAVANGLNGDFGKMADYIDKSVNAGTDIAQNIINYDYQKGVNKTEANYIKDSYSSLIQDLSNAKDQITTTVSGEVDTVFQDNIYIITHSISREYYTRKNFDSLKYHNMYGFVVNDYMKINKFPMRNFVYLKTVDVELSAKINLIIKKKLKEILDNGVRCWRITATNNYVKNMDTRVSNHFNTGAIE